MDPLSIRSFFSELEKIAALGEYAAELPGRASFIKKYQGGAPQKLNAALKAVRPIPRYSTVKSTVGKSAPTTFIDKVKRGIGGSIRGAARA